MKRRLRVGGRRGREPALPGESAGASLKLRRLRLRLRDHAQALPGESAGASLKHHGVGGRADDGRRHSPANLPGPH